MGWWRRVSSAIPIIIHLLNRRRFKVVQWAAMDYLLKAMRRNRKRMKFEQWLLLATRCTLILLFFLGFAWVALLALMPAGCAKRTLGAIGGTVGAECLCHRQQLLNVLRDASTPAAARPTWNRKS